MSNLFLRTSFIFNHLSKPVFRYGLVFLMRNWFFCGSFQESEKQKSSDRKNDVVGWIILAVYMVALVGMTKSYILLPPLKKSINQLSLCQIITEAIDEQKKKITQVGSSQLELSTGFVLSACWFPCYLIWTFLFHYKVFLCMWNGLVNEVAIMVILVSLISLLFLKFSSIWNYCVYTFFSTLQVSLTLSKTLCMS